MSMGYLPRHRLVIGEYAAATQLTAKALRLYDEQGLIKPSAVDPATGYRYYGTDQVATGRLVRVLRDMNLPLTQIKQVLESSQGARPALLREFLREAEQRLARERSAYQVALLMLRSQHLRIEALVREIAEPETQVVLWHFTTNRREFFAHASMQLSERLDQLKALRRQTSEECAIALLEPLTDDDTRVELRIPVDGEPRISGLTLRRIPGRNYAITDAPHANPQDGFAACTDVLFDWFDRKGVQAIDDPEVVLRPVDDNLPITVRWAFRAECPSGVPYG